MKTTLTIAALALATGCAGAPDRRDVTLASAESEPHFADHEGRPAGHHGRPAQAGSGEDDDPWWSSVLGDFIGGFFTVLFSKDDKPAEAPSGPWPADTGGL